MRRRIQSPRRLPVRTTFALLVAAVAQTAWADPQYSILDLGTLGGSRSKAFDISNSGRIVGFSDLADGAHRAFRTADYSAINPAADSLGTITGGSRSYAYSINASGNVVGDGNTSLGFTGMSGDRAYRYTTTMQNLGTLGGDWSYAYGINDSNQVVGGSAITPGFYSQTQAFLYSGSQMRSLGTLGGLTSWARAINKNGYIAGYSQNDLSTYWVEHAFLWSPTTANATTGSMIDLGTLGGTYSYAWSINDRNQVVGAAHLAGDLEYHAFRYSNGEKIDLGTLGGTFSEAYDINLHGEIVGASDDGAGEGRAFLYANGTMYNLNDLIPAGSGWVLQHARAVNDSGYIVGYGINAAGETRGFLLTPLTRDSAWNVDAGGTWSGSANWANGVPNGVASVANFGSAITAPRTIDVDAPYTVGRISFDNRHAYTLAGSGPITLDVSSGNSGITVLSGNHALTVPLVLNDSADVNVLPESATLTIAGSISGAGAAVTKGGAGTLVLSGENTYSGDTIVEGGILSVASAANLGNADNGLILRGGTLQAAGTLSSGGRLVFIEQQGGTIDTNGFDSTFGALAGTGALSKRSPGRLTVPHLRVGDLTVGGGVLRIASGADSGGTSVVNSVVVSEGSQLDLKNNRLIVATGDVGTASAGTYSGLTGQIQSAYNFTSWNGDGITTSMSDATLGLTTIGIATGQQMRGLGPAETDTLGGETITGATVVLMYTYAGDANLDGQIDAGDYGIIDNFVQIAGASGYANGDFNYDGFIDAGDYGIIDNNVQAQGAPIAMSSDISAALAVTAVPEPCGAAIMALAVTALTASRRRRTAARGVR